MSINTDVTLRRLTHELKEWSDNHEMINDFFGYGQFLQLFMEGKREYPAMVVNVTSAASDKWYINYNFEVMILQYVNDEQDNRERAMSDCRQILNDLQETVSYSNRWQSFSRLDGTFNVTPAIQKGADKAYGWIGTFTLKVKKRHGICNLQSLMPEYDFETGTIVSPTCAPVSIYRDEVFEENVESGGRFDYSTACSDATVTVNDEAFNTVASGGTLDVPVEYVNGTPIGTNVDGIIQIPNPITCADVIVNINGELWAEVPSGDTENIIVRQSTGSTQVGEIQGAYYQIADSVAVLKDTSGTIISSTDIKAEDSTDIVAPDSTITVNGGAFDTVASGGTLDVEVEYDTSLDNPIQSIVANKIIIVDPVVLPTNRIYLRPEPTGEIYVPDSEFYLDGCDSWMIHNNIDPIVQTSSGIPMVIDKSKRWKLIPDNVFGNKFRFTGLTGGYYDPETLLFYDSDGTISTYASAFPSDYMIDNSTGLGWQTSGGISNFTFENALADVASLSHAGFDDWYLPNLNQLLSVTDYGYNAPLGSTGDFNPIFTGGISNATKWTSTTIKGLETRVWIVQVIGAVPNNTLKTNITRYIAFRFHFS